VIKSTNIKSLFWPNLSMLRDLLDTLASLHELSDPFGSSSQLQNTLEQLLNVVSTLGLDVKWLTWLQALQNNPQLLNVVLAIGQYLETLIEPAAPATAHLRLQSANDATAPLAIDWNTWLSLLTEIAQLLQQLWPSQ
jgi:hypothetical protein